MTPSAGARVLQADDPAAAALAREGWTVSEESFGAVLHLTPALVDRLRALGDPAVAGVRLRALTDADADAVLGLDAATAADYPGGVATAHRPMECAAARPTEMRRGWGSFGDGSSLVGMTWVDLSSGRRTAEVDVTVVARAWRGQGLATALKAHSLCALAGMGITEVRTGGSLRNPAIMAANHALGFRVDERWVTLVPPGS